MALMCFADKQSAGSSRCVARTLTNGFCLWYKRLEAERFAWPRKGGGEAVLSITARQLRWLLEGHNVWSLKPHKVLKYQCVA
jgi:transposase